MGNRYIWLSTLALLATAAGYAAAQSARPMPALQSLPTQTQPRPDIARVDPMRAMHDQMADLKAQVAALKQANETLAARVQSLDAGLGQVLTQNVTQAKQIADLTSQLGSVSTKLANHRHPFKYARISYHSQAFVTDVGGIGSKDKYENGAVITGTTDVTSTTEPAQ